VNHTDFAERRQDLLESIERDREDVRVALHEITNAVEHKVDIGERIKASPLIWTVGAFFIGVWLGSRAASIGAARQRRAG
jgi:hypothetical protein